MLRKHRKKKILPPPNHEDEPALALSEFGENGKRYNKKEHNFRVFEALRFRALRKGDLVAARLSSRDLWILARVCKDYPGFNIPPADFLRLSASRRDQLFRTSVMVKDVEDKDTDSIATATAVARSLVLPLPRSFAEAAEWGQRYKKGSRVYAMYPQTTSLYSATVTDATSYCRDDDDIIVVQFDGDEADPNTGATPKCHIPARFVILIPREFPVAQSTSSSSATGTGTSATSKRRSATAAQRTTAKVPTAIENDPMNSALMGGLPALEGFDDLEFDLLGGS